MTNNKNAESKYRIQSYTKTYKLYLSVISMLGYEICKSSK
jgi:hypothetical protein